MIVRGITHEALEMLCNQSADVVIVVDAQGRICTFNATAETVFGLQASEVIDHSLHEYPVLQPLLALLEKTTQHNHHATRSSIHLDPDREVTVQLIQTEDAPPPSNGLSAIMHDIVHDLKIPLASAKSMIDLVEALGELNDGQAEYLNRARLRMMGMADLVNEILDLVWMETSGELHRKEIDLIALTKRVVDDFREYATHHNVTIEPDMPEDSCTVLADENRIRSVLTNLISNAIKYSPDGGPVHISLVDNDDAVVVEVQDHGIGIAPQDLPKIFDRFYRVNSPETQRIEGSGLGLPIAKTVIEKHKGELSVKSTPGKGSTFSVWLPKS